MYLSVFKYWMYLSVNSLFALCPAGFSLDDLLMAGICKALYLVISSIGSARDLDSQERWEDADTIVMVQKITRWVCAALLFVSRL